MHLFLHCPRRCICENGNKQPNDDNTSVRVILPSFVYHKSCSFSGIILGTVIQPRTEHISLTAAALYVKLPDLYSSINLQKTKQNKNKRANKKQKTVHLDALTYRRRWERGPIRSLQNCKLSKCPVYGTCLISLVQSCQIKACQKVSELIDAFLFTLQTGQLPRNLDKRF